MYCTEEFIFGSIENLLNILYANRNVSTLI